ncbi:alpha/beta hydrolase [Streptomyces noursei]|uniref:alpha/beta hydrolase n=1 Tax=Streptomyces noursei TaxID=1971 RepID=UPI0033CB713E
MDYTTLRNLKTSVFEDAADGYRNASNMASAAKESLERRTGSAMRKSLSGKATEAALSQLRELAAEFHYTQIECGVIGTALKALAADLNSARKKLDAAVEGATAEKLTVEKDGSVTYPEGGDAYQGKTPPGGTASGVTDATAKAINRQAARFHPNPYYARAQEYADRITAALQEATAADEKWAPKLRQLKADDDLTVSAADMADALKDTEAVRKSAESYLKGIKPPPKNGDPEDNAEWWKHLSEEERAAYISLRPASIGALDGLPAAVRDEANRTVLAEKRSEFELRLNAIPREPSQFVSVGGRGDMAYTQEWLDWHAKYSDDKDYLEGKLKGMRDIQKRFDRTGQDGLPEAYLLGFDPDGGGKGRIILANGNPDTADHTAIYIPGTTTNIETIGEKPDHSDLGRSERLWERSHQLAPDKSISTITWLDYDAPSSIVPEAMQDRQAEKGAPILHQFLEGNRTAHKYATGDTGHTTVVGHSYGSTLIGDTAKTAIWGETPIPADDVLVAGSPGMQVKRAADLGIDPKHMWAMGGGGSDILVRYGGSAAGLGDDWVVPTDPEFGGNILKSDAGDHGAFWDNDSISLKNQAAVVTGKYHMVEHD